jgi:hypothetical protein
MLAGAALGESFFLLMFWANEGREAQAEAGSAGLDHLPEGFSVWNLDNMVFGLPWVVLGLVPGVAAWAVTRTVVTIVQGDVDLDLVSKLSPEELLTRMQGVRRPGFIATWIGATMVSTVVFWLFPDGELHASNVSALIWLNIALVAVVESIVLRGVVAWLWWMIATAVGHVLLLCTFWLSIWTVPWGGVALFSTGALLLAILQWVVLVRRPELRFTPVWIPATMIGHAAAYAPLRESLMRRPGAMLPWHQGPVDFALLDAVFTACATGMALQLMLRRNTEAPGSPQPAEA